MTIYFAGNEPDALNISGVVDSTGSYHDNAYNRVGTKCYSNQWATCTLPSEADTSTAAGVWLHGLFRLTTSNISAGNITGLLINDSSGNPVLRFNAPRPGGGGAIDQVCNLVLYATDGTSGNSPTVAGIFAGSINAAVDFHIRKE